MIRKTLEVPQKTPLHRIELLALDAYGGPSLRDPVTSYLHRVRLERLVSQYPDKLAVWKGQYEAALPEVLEKFARLLPKDADAIILAPSEREDGRPYLERAMQECSGAVDLSRYFTKTSGARSGMATSYAEFAPSIGVCDIPTLDNLEHYLIVDEIFSSGNTAAAIIQRSLEAGAQSDAQWTVAVPLIVSDQGWLS